MNKFIFLIIFLLINSTAFTAELGFRAGLKKYCNETCDLKKKPIQDIQTILLVNQCQDYYQKNKCDLVKSDLNAATPGQVISCDEKLMCSNEELPKNFDCIINGVIAQFHFENILAIATGSVVGAFAGGSAAVGLVASLLFLIYDTGRSAQKCDLDLKKKSTLIALHNTLLLGSEKALEPQDKDLLHMPCSDLQTFLARRIEVFVRKRQERAFATCQTVEHPAPSIAAQNYIRVLNANPCLKQKVIIERYCAVAAGIVTGMALGYTSSKLAHKYLAPDRFAVNGSVPLPEKPHPISIKAATFKLWLKSHMNKVWSAEVSPNVKAALKDFEEKHHLDSGEIYGDSVRQIHIEGETARQLEDDLLKKGFTEHHDFIRDPITHQPIVTASGEKIIMDSFTHHDGGLVRVKPMGDPTNRFRPQPQAVKAVLYPPQAPYDNFEFEAFKVDADGYALPKWEKDFSDSIGKGTPAGRELLDGWADDTHVILVPQ